MHSFSSNGYRIHHNGDFSGDVHIHLLGESDPDKQIILPMELLKSIIAAAVVNKRISKLENMKPNEVLGL